MEPRITVDLATLDAPSFLARNNIQADEWEKANIEYDVLRAIGLDHIERADRLADSAAFFAKAIQRFDAVHSVRWRIKNPEHLMQKIVRKRAVGEAKYLDISLENYHEKITDLIGIRALHLFKEDCFVIDGPMRSTWALAEDPVAYVREGDQGTLTDRLFAAGFNVKSHPAGYRSVHYVFSSQPMARKIFAEVQVRTIFEEGWSEIDHSIRYPNFSDNHLVGFFLAIFNRMAGSADEMGAFVKGLVVHLNESQNTLAAERQQKQIILEEMTAALEELEAFKQADEKSKSIISGLQSRVKKLEKDSATLSIFGSDDWTKTLANYGSLQSEIDKTFAALKESDALSGIIKRPKKI